MFYWDWRHLFEGPEREREERGDEREREEMRESVCVREGERESV